MGDVTWIAPEDRTMLAFQLIGAVFVLMSLGAMMTGATPRA
jgi:hypothetical protein